ncbi:MAG: ABC transporter permease [Clostridiaceae bacterium]|nr:ABC transporter permease [Clostridiaceae bacterium]
MKIANGSMLSTLYKKDIMSMKLENIIMLVGILLGHLYFAYKASTGWHPGTIPFTSSTIFSIVLFVILLGTFSSIRREWNNNTIYLIMSLPVGGKTIFLSKLLTILTQLVVFGGLSVLLGILSSLHFLGSDLLVEGLGFISKYQLIQELLKFVTLLFIGVIQIIFVAFFSSIVGSLFKRFSGFITFAIFVISNVIIGRIYTEMLKLFMHLHIESTRQSISSEFFLAQVGLMLVISIIFFFLTSAVYDKKVEL